MGNHPNRPLVIALLVFTSLLGVYTLTYSGFPASDDEHLFISAAQNLAVHGELEAPQLAGNDRIKGNFSGVEAFHPLIAAPVFKLLRTTPFGSVQGLYLLPPFYTALTAALLLLIIHSHGYNLSTAALSVLIFGFTTIAWPYSQTFFREPLAMLLLTAGWLAFQKANKSGLSPGRRVLNGAAFLLLYLGVLLTKVILLATLPAFLYLFLLPIKPEKDTKFQFPWRRLGALFLAVLMLILLIWGLREFFPPKISTRLSLNFFIRRWGHRDVLRFNELPAAAMGMLFSPAKGLFVYNPVLWLLPLPLFTSGQKQRREMYFALLALAGVLLAQGSIYGARWWNTTWGTRALLPVLPILMGAFIPPLVKIITRWRFAVWGLAIAGVLVQLGGVLTATAVYYRDLYLHKGIPDVALTIWQPAHAPLIEHWRLLLAGEALNPAFTRTYAATPALTTFTIVFIVLSLIISMVLLVRGLFKLGGTNAAFDRVALPISAALILVVCPLLMLSAARGDPRYYAGRTDLAAAHQRLLARAQPGDRVLVYAYLNPAWYYFFNFYKGELTWYSLPDTYPYQRDPNFTTGIVAEVMTTSSRVWLLAETRRSQPEITPAEETLRQYGERVEESLWETPESFWFTRLVLFEVE